jgi:hypothetical protein
MGPVMIDDGSNPQLLDFTPLESRHAELCANKNDVVKDLMVAGI